MKKLIIASFTFLIFSSPHIVSAQLNETDFDPYATASATSVVEEINSYDMFWPIVAGKTRESKLYFLKLWKEKVRELLTFTNFKKADYNITLSVKRTVEAESLLKNEKYDKAKSTLQGAQEKRDRAFTLIEKATVDGDNTTDLKNALKSSLEKQRALLIYLKDNLNSDKVSEVVNSDLSSLNATLEKLQ